MTLKVKLSRIALLLVVILTGAFLSSCSDKDDEPDSGSDVSIVGVWAGDLQTSNYEFLSFSENNLFSAYEIGSTWVDDKLLGTEVYECSGHYTYDPETSMVILHWRKNAPNDDVDIYKVERLTGSRLTITWINDISDKYTTGRYSKSDDIAICRETAADGYYTDPDDTENYTRSDRNALQAEIDKADKYLTED